MARYTGPSCRLCRRVEIKLFLKGQRCHTVKCPIQRRGIKPGIHGDKTAKKLSAYGTRLREVQRVKYFYNIRRYQLKRYFLMAKRMSGDIERNLIQLLERKLDNVVFLLKFAHSPKHARQLIVHGHFKLNGKRVNTPRYLVKIGDIIEPVSQKAEQIVRDAFQSSRNFEVPGWLNVNENPLIGRVIELPVENSLKIMPFNIRLVIEFLS
jgi:small subunit ribosomal protein S4